MSQTREISPAPDLHRTRFGLALFFAITVPSSLWVEGLILNRAWSSMGLVFILMWIPAVASFIVRLALNEGFGDVSFRLGGWTGLKACLTGFLFPLALGAVAYGTAWVAGWASFEPLSPPGQPAPAQAPWVIFAGLLGQALTTGFLYNTAFALGEEIGWRGWMQLRLVQAGVPRPVLAASLFWCAWHFTLFLGRRGPLQDKLLFVAIFTAAIVPVSYLLAWLRFESGSIWPAVILHGAWNSIVNEAFDVSADGPRYLLGEGGVLVAAANWILVALLVRGAWNLRRRPGEEPFLKTEGWRL